MHNTAPRLARNGSARLVSSLAHSAAAVEEVQRLRYRVFGQELGALGRSDSCLDRDFFDPHCDHLLVRETSSNRVVGTYRILNGPRASALGGFYSEVNSISAVWRRCGLTWWKWAAPASIPVIATAR